MGRQLVAREGRPESPSVVSNLLPRTRVPVSKTITQVLELANHMPMRVKDIHEAAQVLLGQEVSYRSLKASLSEGSREPRPKFVRVGYGRYRLRVGS